MKHQKEFETLKEIFKKITDLRGIRRLLSWDQETYMPKTGQENRAAQVSLISSLIHELLTSEETGRLINAICEEVDIENSEDDLSVCIKHWKREYDRATKIPNTLVKELAYKSALAHETWIKAKKSKDFSIFLPDLSSLVKLSIEKAKCLGFEDHPYDALLDEFEPEVKTKEIEGLFKELVPETQQLIETLLTKQKANKATSLKGPFPIKKQKHLATIMANAIGYDLESGRIDTVVHPFSTKIGPGDCRITTRWNEKDFTEAIFSILHEAGHGIYSQNLPAEHYGTPLGESVSLGIHESQSRLWENFIGRSRAFWIYFLPIAKGFFPVELKKIALEEFLQAINKVTPSFIRVEADEVTYNLHIFLRFEIEKDLIAGNLLPQDIPDAWNSLFEKLFGLKVPDDSLGCLQDVHWSGASFGYFPTYTLGNIYAAMLFKSAQKEIIDLPILIELGLFKELFLWLKEKIYTQGKRYNSSRLIQKITGQEPQSKYLIDYLKEKYENLYY